MRVLVVDDNEEICKLACRVLAPYGECDYVLGGDLAINAVQDRWNGRKPFDVVFLDIMMPDKDGISTLREIRALEKTRSIQDSLKIIMLTAFNDANHVLNAFREQADGYIVKPFDEDKLLDEMLKLGLVRK